MVSIEFIPESEIFTAQCTDQEVTILVLFILLIIMGFFYVRTRIKLDKLRVIHNEYGGNIAQQIIT